MTDNEKLMYQILGNFSNVDAPIVFKGALITKLVLAESGYNLLERATKDIDANWIGTPPTMENLTNTVNKSLKTFEGKLYAKAIREYSDKKSAGIAIIDTETGDRVIAMDISIKPVIGSRIYHYGEAEIRGVLANEILADKISVLSKHLIFRRAKDIVDVYALAHCVKVHTQEIFRIYDNNPTRNVGIFDEFYSRRQDVGHAYDKLTGISGKPPFDDVYAYLSKFLHPFANRDEVSKVWNGDTVSWDILSQIADRNIVPSAVAVSEKPSVIDEIREAKKNQRADSTKKTIRKNEQEL